MATTYTRVATTGRVTAVSDNGIKVGEFWWNVSKREPVGISHIRIGDTLSVEGDETADQQRRWITSFATPNGSAPADMTVYDIEPDDMPETTTRRQQPAPQQQPASINGQDGQTSARELIANRLACVQVAASVLGPWWVKRNTDPDGALIVGLADHLLDYVHNGLPADAADA